MGKSLEVIYNERLTNDKFNTSYPLNPLDWERYKHKGSLSFANNEELSFYIHIPFCEHLCRFCEYTRTKCPGEEIQKHYLRTLENDIEVFMKKYSNIILHGFDIGGGTPTVLSEANFAYLIDIFRKTVSNLQIADDFEPSIEATFSTLSESKLETICESGIKRLSLGLQSTNNEMLKVNGRVESSLKSMINQMKMIKSVGVEKINLDLLYGLKGQTASDVEMDISVLRILTPEQITLYELRTNMLNINNYLSKKERFNLYTTLYNGLQSLGYCNQFGQNTFSLNENDFGISSYLRNRMFKGMPYKGFGISAQSMNSNGVSYNVGKNRKNLFPYLRLETYAEEDTYLLPRRELLSKYIAIASYSGQFSLDIASAILNQDSYSFFKEEIDFCIQKDLLILDKNTLRITFNGFENYGSVFSLFYLR